MKSNLHTEKEVKKPTRKRSVPAVLAVPKVATRATKKIEAPKKDKEAVVKKAVTKTPKTTTVPKTKKSKPVAIASEEVKAEVVYVPSSASLRLLEKVEIYRLWYQNKFPREMARIAKVSGYTFVLVGTMLSLYGYLSPKLVDKMPAATICSAADCVEVDDANLVPDAPLVSFLNSLPGELTEDTDITLRSRTGEEPSVVIRAVQSGVSTTLTPLEKMKDGEFRYLIEVEKLGSGFFEIIASIASPEMSYSFSGPTFLIGGFASTPSLAPVFDETNEDSASSTATSTEEVIAETSEVPDTTQFVAPIDLSIEESIDSRFVRIKTGTYVPESVTVKAKVAGTSPAIILGMATLIQSDWIFSLSALNLPQAEYEIFASFASQGRTYQTPVARFVPKVADSIKLSTEDDISLLVGKINLALETADVNNATRKDYFSYIASSTPNFFDSAHEATFASDRTSAYVDRALNSESVAISALLFKYALISGGDNLYLEDYSRYVMRSFFESLARNSVDQREYSAAETLLASRFEALRHRVKEMEDKVADDSNSLTENDTDKDGLSDFDELANTNTDPAKTDTDNDSVLDGIEIIDGTNPQVADLARFPDANSFRIRTDKSPISLRSVRGVGDLGKEAGSVYPVFQGTALKNAYVYIFINGVETAGLIKTGIDGNFEYTFEQVLADGTYQVTAALATASGEVIAETSPLVFTKKADRLAASALFSDGLIMANTGGDSNVPYVVAAAIAVVTFGFVLILLAQSLLLRRRDPVVRS